MKTPKVLVLGFDGLDPAITEAMMRAGRLPHLAALRARGGYARVATTTPAQTPVAWSTFATGVNPGGHGIFDFLRRDPATYFPDLGLNRYEQRSVLLPPKVVNLRRGLPLWNVLSQAGIPSRLIRFPCTYPPDAVKGRVLAGLGVPDIRGGLGTATFYTTAHDAPVRESEQVVALVGNGDTFETVVVGPRNPKTRADVTVRLTIRVDRARGRVTVESDGEPATMEIEPGVWSSWLRLRFRSGVLQSTAGMVRFFLVRLEPHLELYASPVNFDPAAPMFPVSHPPEYAGALAQRIGLYHTTGVAEDHTGLSNERLDEAAFLAHCDVVFAERERMLSYELERFGEGLVFCLFDMPDRVQHMFWRFREPEHPVHRRLTAPANDWAAAIEDSYVRCDDVLGRVLRNLDASTLVIALSDHGFASFQRGVHVNAWLAAAGYLALRPGAAPAEDPGEFFHHVDWGQTRAYALGLGGIYLNVQGREAEGIVAPDEAEPLAAEIAGRLTGLVDPDRGTVAVRGARTRREVYSGPYAGESPDVVADLAAGYRVSWTTALGGVPSALFEDNVRAWSGDHLVDPVLVPGVLFMSRPFGGEAAMVDLAPTILEALGVPVPEHYEGRRLLAGP